mmetsp:Transcript_8705/g.31888  ORF Transcript_8705/g.31888 Transcript_8705/m.31888 type:complete len:710 (-) Transcript_8705:3536-5665(-)
MITHNHAYFFPIPIIKRRVVVVGVREPLVEIVNLAFVVVPRAILDVGELAIVENLVDESRARGLKELAEERCVASDFVRLAFSHVLLHPVFVHARERWQSVFVGSPTRVRDVQKRLRDGPLLRAFRSKIFNVADRANGVLVPIVRVPDEQTDAEAHVEREVLLFHEPSKDGQGVARGGHLAKFGFLFKSVSRQQELRALEPTVRDRERDDVLMPLPSHVDVEAGFAPIPPPIVIIRQHIPVIPAGRLRHDVSQNLRAPKLRGYPRAREEVEPPLALLAHPLEDLLVSALRRFERRPEIPGHRVVVLFAFLAREFQHAQVTARRGVRADGRPVPHVVVVAYLLSNPSQNVQVAALRRGEHRARYSVVVSRGVLPRASVFRRPLQNLEVPPVRRRGRRAEIPRKPLLSAPLKRFQATPARSLRARLLVPYIHEPFVPQPLQRLEAPSSRVRTHVLVPRAPALAQPPQHANLPRSRRERGHVMVPIHTMHRVLEKFEMPALRGGGADVPGAKLGVVDAARVPIPLYEVLLLPFFWRHPPARMILPPDHLLHVRVERPPPRPRRLGLLLAAPPEHGEVVPAREIQRGLDAPRYLPLRPREPHDVQRADVRDDVADAIVPRASVQSRPSHPRDGAGVRAHAERHAVIPRAREARRVRDVATRGADASEDAAVVRVQGAAVEDVRREHVRGAAAFEEVEERARRRRRRRVGARVR